MVGVEVVVGDYTPEGEVVVVVVHVVSRYGRPPHRLVLLVSRRRSGRPRLSLVLLGRR